MIRQVIYEEYGAGGQLLARGLKPERTGEDRCPGCRGGDGPCHGWLCKGCGCCEWSCWCDLDPDEPASFDPAEP